VSNDYSLANCYTTYMTTPLLEIDIKTIRKINNIFCKYDRSGKEFYIMEITNILKGICNSVDIEYAEEFILFYLDESIRNDITLILKRIQ